MQLEAKQRAAFGAAKRMLKHWPKQERKDQRMQQVHAMMDEDMLAELNAILDRTA